MAALWIYNHIVWKETYGTVAKQSLKYRDEDRSLDLYLREIGETPLITADEEVRLARRI